MGSSRPLFWIGSSLNDLRAFPTVVREELGYALYLAQMGRKHIRARPMKGYGGARVLEAVSDHRGDTFRAIYTVRFREAVYVLHAFQKKSKKSISTPRQDLELINHRLKIAEKHYLTWRSSNV